VYPGVPRSVGNCFYGHASNKLDVKDFLVMCSPCSLLEIKLWLR